ncbi:MAG: glycosyltransferase family 10 [Methylocystis sp.]
MTEEAIQAIDLESSRAARSFRLRGAAAPLARWIGFKTKIAFVDFWSDFSPYHGFLKHLLDLSLGGWKPCESEDEADVVFSSVFPHRPVAYPEKTIAFIWENIRPNFKYYRYALSSDIDHYCGRNFRLPVWYGEIAWSPKYRKGPPTFDNAHGNEALLTIPQLLTARHGPYMRRPKFCALVSSHYEPHRMMVADALASLGPVDQFGRASGRTDPRSKYEILQPYVFSLCFENSMFPGYYTEKLVQAWAAETIPLYFSDRLVKNEFNTAAFLNRYDFPTLSAFVSEVKDVLASPERQETIWRQPLMLQAPTLAPAVEFLRTAVRAIQTS